MSIKLKALGLGLVAMLAMGAFAAVNAGATSDGHFIFGSHHVFITGIQEKEPNPHKLHFKSGTGGNQIGCDNTLYTGTHENDPKTPTTTTSLTIKPTWSECYTTGTGEAKWDVHENGCHLLFTSRAAPASNDATVHVQCPAGKAIEITHPNCYITVDPQTVGGLTGNGVTYTNQNDGTSWVTMNVNVKLNTTYHTKACILLGTNQTATMEGSVTVTGFTDAAHTKRTSISAT